MTLQLFFSPRKKVNGCTNVILNQCFDDKNLNSSQKMFRSPSWHIHITIQNPKMLTCILTKETRKIFTNQQTEVNYNSGFFFH